MRVFSGIQPTGAKHIGNYIGAMRQYVATQNENEGDAFFCIVDLHSITVDYDPRDLHDRTLDLAALLYAVGLDADRCVLFCQSHVTAHPELARDVAERFNSRYGETFKVPRGVYPEVGARIMDLQEPSRKMSTTGGTPQGTVLLLDEPDVIRKKFKTAVTDSGREVRYAPEEKPGVSNLVEILSVSSGRSIPEVEAAYDGRGYGDLKTDVGEAV